jgi:hypothetical protein
MTDCFAIGVKLRIDGYQLRTAVDDLHALNLGLELTMRARPQPRRIAP